MFINTFSDPCGITTLGLHVSLIVAFETWLWRANKRFLRDEPLSPTCLHFIH